MSVSRQSKRAKFAHHQRQARIRKAIIKKHGLKPGFLGVAHSVTINGKPFGASPVFIWKPST